MHITQKKFTNQTSFEFLDSALNYSFGDKGGHQTFTVDYAAIDTPPGRFEESKVWYRNFGLLWFVLGCVMTGSIYWDTGQFNPSLWLFLGAGSLVAYHFSRTRYSVFKSEKGEMLVIDDEAHDRIVDEIMSRREACLNGAQ